MSPLNHLLVSSRLPIKTNPGLSADYCLNWERIVAKAREDGLKAWPRSRLTTGEGTWTLLEDEVSGDCAWQFADGAAAPARLNQMSGGVSLDDGTALFPASWENLIRLKRMLYLSDSSSTVFPTPAGSNSGMRITIGANLGLLEWTPIAWLTSALDASGGIAIGAGPTASRIAGLMEESARGSAALLMKHVAGPTIDGLSHAVVMENLKTGFHHRRIPWSLDASICPGDRPEDDIRALASATLVASCITFDFSAVKTRGVQPDQASAWVVAHVPAKIARAVRAKLKQLEEHFSPRDVTTAIAACWPLITAMKKADERLQSARSKVFKAPESLAYLRAVKLGAAHECHDLCRTAVFVVLAAEFEMPVAFMDVTPTGFLPGPHPSDVALRRDVARRVSLLEALGAKARIAVGSLVSPGNLAALQKGSQGRCELRVESISLLAMGGALDASGARNEKELWREWYECGLEHALGEAFGKSPDSRKAARESIGETLRRAYLLADVFGTRANARDAMDGLAADAAHPFWAQYCTGFLSGNGDGTKPAAKARILNAESVRARFHKISESTSFDFSRRFAKHLLGTAEIMRIASARKVSTAVSALERFAANDEFIADISRR